MPMTPELRHGIDRIRDYLFGGGYPNPAQNAEQLSFLIYFYMYEAADAARVRAAKRPGTAPYNSAFKDKWTLRDPRNAPQSGETTVPGERLRWSSWANALNGERLVNWVREEVFAFHPAIAANGATDFMDGARLIIDEPTVLTQVVSQLNDLHLDRVDADTKGDLFEHVLRQIRQADELGQFRTPRHVIRALIRLVDPRIGETIYDPADNPMGWETKTLGDLCDMDRRGIKPNDPNASQFHFVGVENIDSGIGTFNFNSDSRIGAQKSAAFLFDDRHILYGKLRPYLNKVATPDFSGKCSTELIPLLPRDGTNREFLAGLLRREETVDYVMDSVTGSRMPRANMKVLLSMQVPVPPFDIQNQFAKLIQAAQTTTKLTDSSHKTTMSLTASLMSHLLESAL